MLGRIKAAFGNAPPDELPKGRPPYFLRLRSSTGFIAFVVAVGVVTDLSGYALIVPVVPYRLQELGYSDVNSKTGWLVAAYSGGLIGSTPLVAWVGERCTARLPPLIVALLFMAAAQVLFMLTDNYPAMIVSRILQGCSGTGLWTLGLALVTDSAPEARIGTVMGRVMIGFSVGTSIGAPIGGVLYDRLGYKAPFVFSLLLVFADFVLRLLVIEKHTALRWIRAGVEIPGFEAPGYEPSSSVLPPPIPLGESAAIESASSSADDKAIIADPEKKEKLSSLPGLKILLTHPRPLTVFALCCLNGLVMGGLLDTGLTLWLQLEYGLSSLGAGLVFLSLIVPTFFASPLAGIATDRWGAKWICFTGVVLSVPAYACLIIRGPLPLFIFFLCLLGFSMSMFLSPVMHDLSVLIAQTPGMSSAHSFSLFNLSFSIGALIGPIMAGQILGGVGTRRGWLIVCIIGAALSASLLIPIAVWLGGPVRRSEKIADVGAEQDREP